MKKLADLEFRHWVGYIGITVDVSSLRVDGKVKICDQSEEFDPTDNCMSL